MSIVSFLKIMARINKSKKLAKYRQNPGLNQRLPNYSVKMGFGLHVGWAIEGAIGSDFKIDASYLSPNVNMASRLEAATKQFGVPLLISGEIYKVCSAETKKQLRWIDRVTVKGSIQPIDLYTVDVDYGKIKVNTKEIDISTLKDIEKKKARVHARNARNELKENALAGRTKVGKSFYIDKDISRLRDPFHSDFYKKFSEGMDNYISGNWAKAREIFERTKTMIPGREDGPSNTILNFMSSLNGRAPPNWKGYRALTDK